ncbi:MAG: iron-sulfur cluster assembly scaffold protein [Candidatus Aenigmatarchaeota archaeon]|nr:iron-sulfur cluster assembly scaffold protein [Candidatus Aenigmarchaeota archaeon]
MYTKKVLAHFKHPHNMGRIAKPDGVGRVGNPKCGDVMWLYLKIGKNKQGKEIIKDVKFETFGCVAAIATSSMITDLVKGKTIEYALGVTKEKIVKGLGGLPPIKIHCSLLATDALHEAIYNYLKKQGLRVPAQLAKTHERIVKETKVAERIGEHLGEHLH